MSIADFVASELRFPPGLVCCTCFPLFYLTEPAKSQGGGLRVRPKARNPGGLRD